MATFAYPGPHCKQVGILYDTLIASRKLKLKKLTKGAPTKGVLSELNDFRKENDISWEVFHQWIVQLKGEDDINLASLKVSLCRLDKKRAKLKRNKEHSKLEELMSKQLFSSSQCHMTECGESTNLDSTDVLSGNAVIFPDFPPSEDEIWRSLAASSDYDVIAQELLQSLFSSFSVLLSRLLHDHLPGCELDNPFPRLQLQEETKSVPKTNTVSERNFAKLDCLLREKPNATTLSLVAMILFTNNQTASWLRAKPIEEVQELMKKAHSMAPEFKRQYEERRKCMHEERIKLLRAKQLAVLAAQERNVKQKEQLTQEIIKYGLWQSSAQISDGLHQLKSKTEKFKALKAQLNFRKKVLQQVPPNKEIFFTTRNGKQLTIEEISSNLALLLQHSTQVPTNPLTSLIQESLVGKRIRHRWCNPDGTEQWYTGRILSVVPGTTEWFNVQYDGEQEVLSLNLYTDIDNGDLDIVG